MPFAIYIAIIMPISNVSKFAYLAIRKICKSGIFQGVKRGKSSVSQYQSTSSPILE
jgi:hypothetical protein